MEYFFAGRKIFFFFSRLFFLFSLERAFLLLLAILSNVSPAMWRVAQPLML